MATHVFHRRGGPIKDFRGAWIKACAEAGLHGLRFHDLRRSSVRDLVRSGVSEKVAMAISGHKTRAIFDRYNIVDDRDLEEAMSRREDYAKANRGSRRVVSMNPEQEAQA